MENNLIEQGVSLTLYGMGTVFVFLILLTLATRLMSWISGKLLSAPSAIVPSKPPIPALAGESNDARLVAVVTAAVAEYRNGRHSD